MHALKHSRQERSRISETASRPSPIAIATTLFSSRLSAPLATSGPVYLTSGSRRVGSKFLIFMPPAPAADIIPPLPLATAPAARILTGIEEGRRPRLLFGPPLASLATLGLDGTGDAVGGAALEAKKDVAWPVVEGVVRAEVGADLGALAPARRGESGARQGK